MPHHPHAKQNLIPYLNVADTQAMIDFCSQAFGAELAFALKAPNGQYMHVDMRVEEATIMMSSMHPPHMERAAPRPPHIVPPVTLLLYVADCDATHAKAVAAGAKSLHAPENMFYGDRAARILDPQGNVWILSQHVETLTPEEVNRRAQAMFDAN